MPIEILNLLLLLGSSFVFFIMKLKEKEGTKKDLPIEQVLKEAEEALRYDPLEDSKNKPQAVQSLCQVLLAIREKKAEEDLLTEEHARQGIASRRNTAAVQAFEKALKTQNFQAQQNANKQNLQAIGYSAIGTQTENGVLFNLHSTIGAGRH